MSKHLDVRIVKPGDLDGPRTLGEMGLTLIHPFYGEAKRFELQWENWLSFSKRHRKKLDIIVVDDHGTPLCDPTKSSSKPPTSRNRSLCWSIVQGRYL